MQTQNWNMAFRGVVRSGRQQNPKTKRSETYQIGLRVQALRLSKGWTQRDLAERARMRTCTISAIEMGRYREVGSLKLRALKQALGCTSDFLLGE
jgi:DNA-binding XRE family transcriptional regulator